MVRGAILSNSTERDEIRALLAKVNNAWLKGSAEDIKAAVDECFGDNIVVVGPEFKVMARGKPACAQGYEAFIRSAGIRECRLADAEVEIFSHTAVATYSWDMLYEMQGQEYRESGHDVFVLTRAGGRWRAIWRAVLLSKRT